MDDFRQWLVGLGPKTWILIFFFWLVAILIFVALKRRNRRRQTLAFEHEGFFSPELDRFRDAIRTTHPTKPWFDFALDLNRIGFDLLRQAKTLTTDNALFTMHGVFVRTHQSFQAALLLAERGLIGDARTVLRSGFEGAIAIQALAADPNFVQRLIDAHYINQRKIARIVLDDPQYQAHYNAAEIAEMQRVKADVDAMEAAPNPKLRDITWADVARDYCPDLYQLLYRQFSSDGTHTTINSINRYVISDGNMRITGFRAAPDGEGTVEVLSAACLLFFWAADPFALAVNRPDITAQIQQELARFGTLPGAFPGTTPHH